MFFLSAPYPEETVGSLLIRMCRHSGIPSHELLASLGGGVPFGVGFTSVSRLRAFADCLDVCPKHLLHHHTLMPFSIAFLPEETAQITIKDLLDGKKSHLKWAWPFFTSTRYWSFCKVCRSIDLKSFGESYWHVGHQAPGMSICVEHGTPLTKVTCSNRRLDSRKEMPHEFAVSEMPVSEPEILMNSAVCDVLYGESMYRDDWSSRFRLLAEEKGFMPELFRASTNLLVEKLVDFYGLNFLSMVLPVRGDSPFGQARSVVEILRPSAMKKGASTIACLLLQTFLLNAQAARVSKSRRELRDSYVAELLTSGLHCVNQDAGLETAKAYLSRKGQWSYYAHFRDSMPLSRAAVRAWCSSNRRKKLALK